MITSNEEAIEFIKKSGASIFIACTGGGAGLQELLWAQPGASSFLVGGLFPYSTSEFDSFIGFRKEKEYCSMDGAIELAMASYIRAREYCILNKKDHPVGLGISAACTTDRELKGKTRLYVATCSHWGIQTSFVILSGESSRIKEGKFIDNLGLAALISALGEDLVLGENLQFHVNEMIKDISGGGKYIELNGNFYPKFNELLPERAREIFFRRPYYTAHGTKEPIHKGQTNNCFMPGSFNPIHDGHRDNAWKVENQSNNKVTYMVTADSVHKKSLSVPELLDRVAMMNLERFGSYPEHGIIFTQNDPLFINKARQFPHSEFVVGYDTVERMLDPSWGPEIIPMLHEFRLTGTKFLVCGRIINGQLKTLTDLTELIPYHFSDLFEQIHDTGTDHSSTKIRESNEVK